MQFLPSKAIAKREIQTALERGCFANSRELKRLIPAQVLIKMQVVAAMTGFLPTYDEHGNEVEVAQPVPLPMRMDLINRLVDKRLPNMKAVEGDERTIDLSNLPTEQADANAMTPDELQRAIEATYTVEEPPSHE